MFDRNKAAEYAEKINFDKINPQADHFPEQYGNHQFSKWGILPPDTDQPGFAPGMDDVGQIVLNNKYRVMYDKNTITEAGARDFVARKNKTIKEPKKHWEAAYQDINNDGVKDVLIRDGNKKIKYINGWHLGKANKNDLAYQKYIEKTWGLPYDRLVARARGMIPEKALSRDYFLHQNMQQDPNNPDGPLLVSDYLKAHGIKSRAPSAANLLLSYVTKNIYNDCLNRAGFDENKKKMIKKLCGVIQANAIIYRIMVTDVVDKQCEKEGLNPKEAKKKHSGQVVSTYSEKCLKRVKEIAENKNRELEEVEVLIVTQIFPLVTDRYQYQGSNAIYDKDGANGLWNGRVRPLPTTSVPNIDAILAGQVPINQAAIDEINKMPKPKVFRTTKRRYNEPSKFPSYKVFMDTYKSGKYDDAIREAGYKVKKDGYIYHNDGSGVGSVIDAYMNIKNAYDELHPPGQKNW